MGLYTVSAAKPTLRSGSATYKCTSITTADRPRNSGCTVAGAAPQYSGQAKLQPCALLCSWHFLPGRQCSLAGQDREEGAKRRDDRQGAARAQGETEYCMLHAACCMLHVACCLLHVACCMLHVARLKVIGKDETIRSRSKFGPTVTGMCANAHSLLSFSQGCHEGCGREFHFCLRCLQVRRAIYRPCPTVRCVRAAALHCIISRRFCLKRNRAAMAGAKAPNDSRSVQRCHPPVFVQHNTTIRVRARVIRRGGCAAI